MSPAATWHTRDLHSEGPVVRRILLAICSVSPQESNPNPSPLPPGDPVPALDNSGLCASVSGSLETDRRQETRNLTCKREPTCRGGCLECTRLDSDLGEVSLNTECCDQWRLGTG